MNSAAEGRKSTFGLFDKKPRAQSVAEPQGQVYKSTDCKVSGNRGAKSNDYLMRKLLLKKEFKFALSEFK